MPIVDYAEWFRQQQQRQGMGGMPGATGSLINPGTYQGYKPESWKEQRGELLGMAKETASGAAQGASVGSVAPGVGTALGAAIGGILGSVRGQSQAIREAWDAAKQGDTQSFYRNLMPYAGSAAPFAPALALGYAAGKVLPRSLNPVNWPVLAIKELFGGPQTKIEEKRWDRLKDYGFEVPKWAQGNRELKFDAFRQDLPPDYVGYDKAGNWVNNRFARSRSEADLTATDVSQTAAMAETFGLPYQKASQQTKDAMANIALQNKLIQEQKGTMNIAWDQDKYKQAADILMQDKGAQQYLASQPREYVSKLKFKGIE
jgi:hypothetical protein